LSEQTPITYGRGLTLGAAEHPDRPAIILRALDGQFDQITYSQLEASANRLAHRFEDFGLNPGSRVAVGLPNSIEHFVAALATWKIGACVIPLNPLAPPLEREPLIRLMRPQLVVADWEQFHEAPTLSSTKVLEPGAYSDSPLRDHISEPGVGFCSGGSTGRPKVILESGPFDRVRGEFNDMQTFAGMTSGQRQLATGPLHHITPFVAAHVGLQEAGTVVLMARFDPDVAVSLIEQYRVEWVFLVPTMMARIARLDGIENRDLSSLQAVLHGSAPCPEWVKRAWIKLIGARKVREGWGSTEGVGHTSIDGEEWLRHPGSVGRPVNTELRILDPDGTQVPAGTVGEIFSRKTNRKGNSHKYLGAPPNRSTPDGLTSLGDLGWIDEDGFLYIADRRVDLIIRGGANIYPAEVEAALTEHPGVADAVVVGLPDADLGRVVLAIVRPLDPLAPPSIEDLDAHMRARLAGYKVPALYEFIDEFPRNDSGKVRRSQLAADRATAAPDARPTPKRHQEPPSLSRTLT
jgi:bile acid-coenzyme A ligase